MSILELNIASDQLKDEATLLATLESSLPLMMQNSIYKCAARLRFSSPSSFMAYGWECFPLPHIHSRGSHNPISVSCTTMQASRVYRGQKKSKESWNRFGGFTQLQMSKKYHTSAQNWNIKNLKMQNVMMQNFIYKMCCSLMSLFTQFLHEIWMRLISLSSHTSPRITRCDTCELHLNTSS